MGEGDDTGHTSRRSVNPFRVAATGSAYRRGFRSPEAPTWRLHPLPDAGSAANGGICGAARKASSRQRAPPGASEAGSCGGSPWEAARLRARAGERTSRSRLRTPRPPRPGSRPAGEGRGRAGAAGRVALSQSRARRRRFVSTRGR